MQGGVIAKYTNHPSLLNLALSYISNMTCSVKKERPNKE